MMCVFGWEIEDELIYQAFSQLDISINGVSLVAQMVKNLHRMQDTQVQSLEKGMAAHSSIVPWRIPWT